MGMDRKIKKKTWTTNRIIGLVLGVVVIAFFVYSFWFADFRSTLNVDREKLTITTIAEDSFQEFIQVTGNIQPINTIFLDAIEGGTVQRVVLETGTNVQPGDTIVVLSNSNLQLQVLQQEAGLYDQINNVRNSRLNLEQNSLRIKEQLANAEYQLDVLRPRYERQQRLFNENLISREEYEETKENFKYEEKRYELTYESFLKDSLQTISQLRQLDESEQRMWRSLNAVQEILDNLIITAPIDGQLTTIELQQGQSINRSERIGQVDMLDNFKVRVGVDEFHLSRITTGLRGSFDFAGESYDLAITKVYPVIANGQFQVDMEFQGETPSRIRRGQRVRIRLELGDTSTAVLLERGGFFNSSGGSWVYKLDEDEQQAVRTNIRLGQQNPDYFEVISGLSPGDKVIISSYDTFGDNEVLNLQ
ncbi:MAG: HlyD family efflux transporter periplasmic adaptor subunit [Balneola sp.]|nr:MAG: HlyD family efflux transporter periplasmic adaptor subunit [Balneola sp.]